MSDEFGPDLTVNGLLDPASVKNVVEKTAREPEPPQNRLSADRFNNDTPSGGSFSNNIMPEGCVGSKPVTVRGAFRSAVGNAIDNGVKDPGIGIGIRYNLDTGDTEVKAGIVFGKSELNKEFGTGWYERDCEELAEFQTRKKIAGQALDEITKHTENPVFRTIANQLKP